MLLSGKAAWQSMFACGFHNYCENLSDLRFLRLEWRVLFVGSVRSRDFALDDEFWSWMGVTGSVTAKSELSISCDYWETSI